MVAGTDSLMSVNMAIVADQAVEDLCRSLASGEMDLRMVPRMIERVLSKGFWRSRYCRVLERTVEFSSFGEFVAAHPPEGLGTALGQVKAFCVDKDGNKDLRLLDLVDQATRGETGRPKKETVYNIHDKDRPAGTSASAALRRLRSHAPDLHTEVLAGNLSPHAACIQAGFRKKTATIPLEPQSAARALIRRFSDDELAQLAQLINSHLAQ